MNTDTIEKKIVLRASLARVWRAISDPAEFGAWFGMKLDGPFTPGVVLHAVIVPTVVDEEVAKMQKPYEGRAFEITVEQVEPERLLSFRWHPYGVEPGVDLTNEPTTLVAFELEQVPDGVLLTITESGFDRIPVERRARAFHANEQGWSKQLNLIEGWLVRTP